jgi:hypothetical protein
MCKGLKIVPEPTSQSAVPGEGTNSPRLFTSGETKALAKSKVHQISRASVTNGVEWVASSLISKIWLIACRSGMSKISILKDIYLENRFIYNKHEAILFEEMRRINLLREIGKYTTSLL